MYFGASLLIFVHVLWFVIVNFYARNGLIFVHVYVIMPFACIIMSYAHMLLLFL